MRRDLDRCSLPLLSGAASFRRSRPTRGSIVGVSGRMSYSSCRRLCPSSRPSLTSRHAFRRVVLSAGLASAPAEFSRASAGRTSAFWTSDGGIIGSFDARSRRRNCLNCVLRSAGLASLLFRALCPGAGRMCARSSSPGGAAASLDRRPGRRGRVDCPARSFGAVSALVEGRASPCSSFDDTGGPALVAGLASDCTALS
jgi:hypothetical protein